MTLGESARKVLWMTQAGKSQSMTANEVQVCAGNSWFLPSILRGITVFVPVLFLC